MVLTQIVCLGAYVTFLPCPLTYYDRVDKNQNQNLKKTLKISLYPVHIGCSDISDKTRGIEKTNHQILHKKYQL